MAFEVSSMPIRVYFWNSGNYMSRVRASIRILEMLRWDMGNKRLGTPDLDDHVLSILFGTHQLPPEGRGLPSVCLLLNPMHLRSGCHREGSPLWFLHEQTMATSGTQWHWGSGGKWLDLSRTTLLHHFLSYHALFYSIFKLFAQQCKVRRNIMEIEMVGDLSEKRGAYNRKTSGTRDQRRVPGERPPLDITPEKKRNDSSEMAHSPGLGAQRVHRSARSLQKTPFVLCNLCPVPLGTMRNFSMAESLFPGTVNWSVCAGLSAQRGQAGGLGAWESLGRHRRSVFAASWTQQPSSFPNGPPGNLIKMAGPHRRAPDFKWIIL